MSFDETKLMVWMDQTDKKLARLEANQTAIINGDFCRTNAELKEPLIKDEKIRKAVRAWAEANDFAKIEVTHCRKHYLRIMNETTDILIEFSCFMDDLLDERVYTIAELCGEE